MSALRPLVVIGTRPEAIKMAPVLAACQALGDKIEPLVCFTGQHDEMLRQTADYFGIRPQFDLKLMTPGQSLAELTGRAIVALNATIEAARPSCVVAQGDTTSVLASSIAAFYQRLPFVHVEAGLRTHDLSAPWPEEFNRRVASIVTSLHCAPTPRAAETLHREGVAASRVRVTGNTVIDALLTTATRERERESYWRAKYGWLEDHSVVLVTIHRRENHGERLAETCRAIAELAHQHEDVRFIFPVHLNPQVQDVARRQLGGIDNVRLISPVPYPEFVWLMQRSKLIVSDSGGVQEEAPSLRRPVVALRESTERSEAVEIGAVVLVGCSGERIVSTVAHLLTDARAYSAMQVERNPFGDGRAAQRIVEWMMELT